ncbi:ubiquitin-protein ligase E3C-like [Cimex lectularius]|uniref:HECT-type E3 ubiquitin transferase n=1 Tax=Cimex lectularius TaxID=79782 RepID=A0A8I6RBD0_CIMLE|nr:ubiquitin-protein ligase E3C-like [Cimex lectularius]
MYYFEGNYRVTPEQNFAGASRQSRKTELIDRAQAERRKREEERARSRSAVVLQSLVRGFLARRRIRNVLIEEFDRYRLEGVDTEDLAFLIRRIPFLEWSPARLLSASRMVLEHKEAVLASEDPLWAWRLRMLLDHHLCLLQIDVQAVSKEFVDFFTDRVSLVPILGEERASDFAKTAISHAVGKNYFETCLRLLRCSANPIDLDYSLAMLSRPFHIDSSIVFDKFCQSLNHLEIDENDKKVIILLIAELKKMNLRYIEFYKSILRLDFNSYNPLLLWFVLNFDEEEIAEYDEVKTYFSLMARLSKTLHDELTLDTDWDSQDSEERVVGVLIAECLALINCKSKALIWLSYLERIIRSGDFETLVDFGICLHNLYLNERLPVNRNLLFVELYRNKSYIKYFWCCIASLQREGTFSDPIPLTNLIVRNIPLEKAEIEKIVPLLTIFAVLMKFSYSNMTEEELMNDNLLGDKTDKPFQIQELVALSKTLVDITMGVVLIAYPETYSCTNMMSMTQNCQLFWSNLLKELVNIISLLHAKDARKRFAGTNHWLSNQIKIADHVQIFDSTKTIFVKPFSNRKGMARNDDGLYVLSVQESRTVFILHYLPFTVPFLKRYSFLQAHFEADKRQHRNEHILQIPHRFVRIRRDYLYEDAFDNLSKHDEDIKISVKIQMVNSYGLEEAGVDGGGVFREFLTDLLKTAFDPTRGFFIYNNDNELYPNPSAKLVSARYTRHYHFIGRILAKAIFEGVMSEIRLAEFFLAKLTGITTNLHLSNLASLDPELYKNIVNLQKYKGDFSDLGLDFTIYTNEFGRSVCRELKPNGSNIQVTADNVSEYIDLIAKFKMHSEILKQTESFVEGIASVFSLDCLKMFTPKELQTIISGDEAPIDIDDMRRNTVYAGGFSPDHPSVVMFWNVVDSFGTKEKSQLLKFITSYSRPPLLGFKELHPQICIQRADGENERFPTSSTCMHLLKLPAFSDEDIMRKKLLYAIKSGAGFELS